MEEEYYKQLIQRFADRSATDQELEVFIKLANEGKLDAYLTDSMNHYAGITQEDENNFPAETRTRTLWPRIAAAASILLVLSAGSYFILHQKKSPQRTAQIQKQDVLPGHEQATLTLANGQKIVLNKGLSGKLAQQGNTSIQVNNSNALTYLSKGANPAASYNTMSTMKGEESPYPLILADGTKVWLNAESSITFPTAFNGKERIVKITGEAYFEVVHNAAQPFKVSVKGQTIEDIGTHFNINAYDDEPETKTTLMEGSVKVSNGNKNVLLLPGQETVFKNSNFQVTNANIDQVIAWHKGLFEFDNADLETVMRQLSRWYNIDVAYEGKIPAKVCNGKVYRNLNLSQVLEVLQYAKVHFRIEGRKIIVYP